MSDTNKEPVTAEEIFMQMTVILNEMSRAYDNKKDVKFLIDKGYNLSLHGYKHLELLDAKDKELSDRDEVIKGLQSQLSEVKERGDKLIDGIDVLYSNYELWKYKALKDGAFSWHLNNWFIRFNKAKTEWKGENGNG